MEETEREEPKNPTQERMDEEGMEDKPADVPWETNDSPHQGEEGQSEDAA